MPSAQPPGWPADKPLAISVNVMLEGWAEGSAPGIGPMGNPLKPGVTDLQALSWAEYGPKVGAWRLLDLLDREQYGRCSTPAAWSPSAIPTCRRRSPARGHAVAAHGWSQGTLPAYQIRGRRSATISLAASRFCGAPPGSGRAAG